MIKPIMHIRMHEYTDYEGRENHHCTVHGHTRCFLQSNPWFACKFFTELIVGLRVLFKNCAQNGRAAALLLARQNRIYRPHLKT